MIPKVVLIAAALLSPLLFPWQVTIVLASIASVILPPVALVAGIFTDALYWSYGSIPFATLIGLLATAIAYVIEGFIRTRIMGR